MTETICRYLATPSHVFELVTELDQQTMTMQKFAIIRLAQCVQVNTNAHDISTVSLLLFLFFYF